MNIHNPGELIGFAYDVEFYWYDHCDWDVFDEDGYNEYVDNEVSEWTDDWTSLRDYLDLLPSGYDWYYRDEWGEICGLAYDEADVIRQPLLEWCDENNIFDDDQLEEPEEIPAETQVEPEEEAFESGFSIEDFVINIDGVGELIKRADPTVIVVDDLFG